MNKLVYLHELDSVRTSELGIERGIKCLFEEVVENGNYVAITMNQLADSKIILTAIQNKENFKYILELFEKGIIRISRYMIGKEEIRTPAQYILNSLNKNIIKKEEQIDSMKNRFISSALPIKHNDVELMTVLCNAITYSEPDYVRAECEKLVSCEKYAYLSNDIIDYLCTYVDFILSISKLRLATNPPKKGETLLFVDFMGEIKKVNKWFTNTSSNSIENEIVSIYNNVLTKCESRYNLPILDLAGEYVGEQAINNRSKWHDYFIPSENYGGHAKNDFGDVLSDKEIEFAEMLIDICYNYAVEESIANVSHHYTDYNDKESLHADIKERIIKYWSEIEEGIYSPHRIESNNNFVLMTDEKFPDWDVSSRIIRRSAGSVCGRRYEEDYQNERKEWHKKIKRNIVRNIVFAVFYIIIFLGVEWFMGYIEGFFAGVFHIQIVLNGWRIFVFGVLKFAVYYLFINIFKAIIGKVISESNYVNIPDILESIGAITRSVGDLELIRKKSTLTYRRNEFGEE